MSKFSKFMKANKKAKENVKLQVTESLIDPDTGEPLLWEIRSISTNENQRLMNECTKEVPTDKSGQYRMKVDQQKYLKKLVCASVVYPDLYDTELQDSYGVKTPEDLIGEMIDDLGEYNALLDFITRHNHLDKTLEQTVEEAKN